MFRNSLRLCNSLACRVHPCSGTIGLQHVRCIAQSVVSAGKDVETYYQVLGLPSSASHTQIRNAYLQLSKQQLNRGELHGKEKFARLKEAYDVLSDSSSRGEYDRQLGLVTKGSDASLPSRKSDRLQAPAMRHDVQLVTGGVYRKLMQESHKRLGHNIDIAPQICLTIMIIAMLYVGYG